MQVRLLFLGAGVGVHVQRMYPETTPSAHTTRLTVTEHVHQAGTATQERTININPPPEADRTVDTYVHAYIPVK